MQVFNPATFSSAGKPHHIDVMFQGAVTMGKKLPMVKKHKKTLSDEAYLVGYPGKQGCFSVIYLGDNLVDVAFYTDCEPKDLNEVSIVNALYEQYEVVPGWGFSAMVKMKELLIEEETLCLV